MRAVLSFLAVCCWAGWAGAGGAPETLNYQGRLTNPQGGMIADGSHTLVFSLYAQSAGGAALWSSTREIHLSKGVLNVSLDDVPATLLDGSERWLGTQVDGDSEMAPRQQVVSSPYALLTSAVGDNTITSAKIVDGAITNADLSPSAAIAQSKISNATPAINADQVDGKHGSELAQLSPASPQTGHINVTGTATIGGNATVTGDLNAHANPVGELFWSARQSAEVSTDLGNGWTDVPGLNISFTLPRNATVHCCFTASDYSYFASSGAHHNHRFVIDGTSYGDPTYGSMIQMGSSTGGWWNDLFDEWVIELNAGTHSVKSQIAVANVSGVFTLYMSEYSRAYLTATAYGR